MKQERMDARQALSEGAALPYALIFTYSGVTLGLVPDAIPERELTEARFFSEEREIHVWRDGGTLRAASLSDTDADDSGGVAWYRLEKPELGECLAVKQYLEYDDDGQAYISARRLAGWKGGNRNG